MLLAEFLMMLGGHYLEMMGLRDLGWEYPRLRVRELGMLEI